MPPEKSVNITWPELTEGVQRAVGSVHELVAPRVPVHVYNLQGAFFFPDGAVLMPHQPSMSAAPVEGSSDTDTGGDADAGGDAEAPPEPKPEQTGEGLLLIRNLFSEISSVSGKKCLVAAHTDQLPGAPAIELTQRRADNVLHYLQGDREAWAKSCMPCQDSEWQAILQWVAQRFGFPCDPGPISDPLRAQARVGLRRFRVRFNAEFGGALEELADINEQDFAAFFDLYDAWVARMLEADDLSAPRGELKFLDPAAVGSGDAFPNQPPRAPEFEAPDNRRVELLFFDSGNEPNLEMTPPGAHVYERREFLPTHLPIEPKPYVVLELAFSEHVVDALPEGATLELTGPPGPPQTRLLSDGTRDAGGMRYYFDWLDDSIAVTLKAKAGKREETLFADQVKGDLESKPIWKVRLEHVLEDEVVEQEEDPVRTGRLPAQGFDDVDAGPVVRVRVHDANGQPAAGVPFRVVVEGLSTQLGLSGEDGVVEVHVPQPEPAELSLQWGADPTSDVPLFARPVRLAFRGGPSPERTKARLHNLGYDVDTSFDQAVDEFQRDYQVDLGAGAPGGNLPEASALALDSIYDARDGDATPGASA